MTESRAEERKRPLVICLCRPLLRRGSACRGHQSPMAGLASAGAVTSQHQLRPRSGLGQPGSSHNAHNGILVAYAESSVGRAVLFIQAILTFGGRASPGSRTR
jgi:hypothetical protein